VCAMEKVLPGIQSLKWIGLLIKSQILQEL
jgi:hypothetical protein